MSGPRLCAIALLASVVAGAPLLMPASVEASEETVRSGTVEATLSYERERRAYRDLRVRVVRAGVTLVDAPVPTGCPDPDECFVVPAKAAADRKSIAVRDLDGDSEPEVLVDIYTGGAHCCTISAIYWFDAAAARYRRLRRNWLDPGYRLRDLGGRAGPELVSRDARFSYRYSSYAESYPPLRVFRFSAGRLHDVSRRFPARLRADARSALRLYHRVRRGSAGVRGILAAYAADKYRLGERRSARRTLFAALRRGDLAPQYSFEAGPFGSAYIRRLDGFLRRIGYGRR